MNDTDTQMRVINIQRDIFELPECLEEFVGNQSNDDDTDITSDDNNEGNCQKYYKIYKKKKFIGDLIISYKGIKYNDFKVDFIVYGINKKEISVKEWEEVRDVESKEKVIQIISRLSVF